MHASHSSLGRFLPVLTARVVFQARHRERGGQLPRRGLRRDTVWHVRLLLPADRPAGGRRGLRVHPRVSQCVATRPLPTDQSVRFISALRRAEFSRPRWPDQSDRPPPRAAAGRGSGGITHHIHRASPLFHFALNCPFLSGDLGPNRKICCTAPYPGALRTSVGRFCTSTRPTRWRLATSLWRESRGSFRRRFGMSSPRCSGGC